jgi:hypothetical protein
MTDDLIVMGGLGVAGALSVAKLVIDRRRQRAPKYDDVLLHWNEHDAFTETSLYEHLLCLGRIGSGKTSSMWHLARAVVNKRFPDGRPKFGGSVFCSKPEDKPAWVEIFERAGVPCRVIEPGGARCSILDYQMKLGKSTKDIAKTLEVISESLRASRTDGDGKGEFFHTQGMRLVRYTMDIQRVGKGYIDPFETKAIINNIPMAPGDIHNEGFQKGVYYRAMQLAADQAQLLTEEGRLDFELAMETLGAEFPALNPETKTSIISNANLFLDVFCERTVRTLFATDTTVTPEDTLNGQWVLVNLPISVHGDAGAFGMSAWLKLNQDAVLRRVAGPDDPGHVIWIDEAHRLITSDSSPYANECRSHKGAMVYISQSIPQFYAALGGTHKGKYMADALLGAMSTKVLFPLGDVETPEWAMNTVGRMAQMR